MMYEVHVSGFTWHNFALEIKEFDASYNLNTSGINVKAYVSVIMDGFNGLNEPNFITNSYVVNDF